MVETTDNNKELYADLAAVLQKEKQNQPVSDEQKEQILRKLNEMANTSMDFDADNLDNIIAFAQNYGNNDMAEKILHKAQEQKNKIEQDGTNTVENSHPDNLASQFRKDIEIINQPSYNVYRQYSALKNKENLQPQEQAFVSNVEKQVEAILANVEPQYIDEENAVAIKDYLEISNQSNPDKNTQQRNQKLLNSTEEKLKKYDQLNGLENVSELTPEIQQQNVQQWIGVAQQVSPQTIMPTLKPIIDGLSPEDKKELLLTLQKTTIYDLSTKAPDENGKEICEQALANAAAEYKVLINAEYLKQEALAEFCAKNKINQQNLNDILQNAEKGIALSDSDKKLKEEFEKHLTKHLEKFPNFNGPYTNKEFLKNAATLANAVMINRQTTKECRRARLMNAPQISKAVEKLNNDFAEKHPKLYKGVNMAKTIGLNFARTAIIGATLGPVGLTAYSAFRTAKTIRKAYQQYRAKQGLDSFSVKNLKGSMNNFVGFIKYLGQKENRAEALNLIGQVASTAISGYFSLSSGLENMNLGLVGKTLGHTAENAASVATEAAQHIDTFGGAVKAGFEKIISSPRRAATMLSSLGIGTVKFLSESYNLRSARNNLKNILEQNGATVSKDVIKQLEQIEKPEQFMAIVKQIAPNINKDQAEEAFKNAELARKSNPKTAAIAAISGATVGLVAAATAEYLDSTDTLASDTTENNDHNVNDATTENSATIQSSSAAELWNNNESADKRLDSFGIDAKNANEMLREMGVIEKDDHHFYRQHELANLVNQHQLSDEQKTQIQEWANDRESRVHNLKTWIAEHSQRNTHSHGAGAGQSSSSDMQSQENAVETKGGFTLASVEKAEENTVETHKYKIQGRIDKLKGLNGEVEAENKIAAVREFEKSQQMQKSSKLTITDEDGNKTVSETRIGHKSNSQKITEYEGDKKTLKQQTTYYKDGDRQGSFKTTVRADVDGDGKKDKIVTTTGADGNSVTYTKMSSGERQLEVKDAEGNSTKLSTSEMMEKGVSKSEARGALKDSYDKLSRQFQGRGER